MSSFLVYSSQCVATLSNIIIYRIINLIVSTSNIIMIHTYIVHPYTCFLSTYTSLAISVNRSSSITHSDEKRKCRDVHVLYMCADYPYYSCLFAF